MADVINLNKFKKRIAKTKKAENAELNRQFHGRNKEERKKDELIRLKNEQSKSQREHLLNLNRIEEESPIEEAAPLLLKNEQSPSEE